MVRRRHDMENLNSIIEDDDTEVERDSDGLYLVDAEGDYHRLDLPTKWAICPECDGDGHCLPHGMRGYGYTQEEWDRDWDHEDRQRYFSGGYDVQCDVCHGSGKVQSTDWESVVARSPKLYELLMKFCDMEHRFATQEAYERKMGC